MDIDPNFQPPENTGFVMPREVEEMANPVLPIHNLQQVAQLQEQQKQREIKLLERRIKEEKMFTVKLYATQTGLALVGGVLVAIFCYLINPPLTQYYHEDPFTMTTQDWRKVLLFVAIVVVLIFLIPEISRLFSG